MSTLCFMVLGLSYFQNITFAIVSRARNRNSVVYHAIASVFANASWFLTFRELVAQDMSFELIPWYVCGTVCGSLTGSHVSGWVERVFNLSADAHIPKLNPEEVDAARDLLKDAGYLK